MRRERLLSGQRWFFDEDGFDVTLDLVVDVREGVTEKSQVMIGGLWYSEETVQEMVAGRRNSFYEVSDDWCHAYVTSDVKVIYSVIDACFDEHDDIEDVVRAAVAELCDDVTGIGNVVSCGVISAKGVTYFIRSIAMARRDIKKRVTMF